VDALSASPSTPGKVVEALERDGNAPEELGKLHGVFENLMPVNAPSDAGKTASAVLGRLKADASEVTHTLMIEDESGTAMTIPLSSSVTTTVGRSPGNLVVLPDRNVSRLHCEITIDGDKVEIADFSRNGTRHNGQLIEEKALLKRGDVVQIGDYRIRMNITRKAMAAASADATIAPSSGGAEIRPEEAARLVVVSSNYHGREFHLTREQNIIGRVDADILIDHRSISSWHAKVVREGESYKIVDLGSSNGIIINGEKYRTSALRHGDDVELGHVKLRFVGPGKDFVFEPVAAPKQGSGMGLGIAAAVVLLVLIAGSVTAFVVLSKDDGKPSPSTSASPAAVAPSETPSSATPAPSAESAEVTELLGKGNEAYEGGNWDKAIVYYDMVLEKQPTSEQARDRKSTLTKEKPFKRLFDDGKVALSEKRYEDAIRMFKQIPEGASLFADRVRSEGLLETAMNGLLDKHLEAARAAIGRKKWKEARAALDEAELLDPESDKVAALRKEVNKKDRKGAAAEARARAAQANKGGKGGKAGAGGKSGDDDGGAAAAGGGGGGGGSAEDRKAKGAELLASARKKSLTGDHNGAIQDANEALKYGMGFQAHYFLAISYEKIGNNAQAVTHYNAWIKSNCGNKLAERVRSKIQALGGTPAC